jgi:hypothetical protein
MEVGKNFGRLLSDGQCNCGALFISQISNLAIRQLLTIEHPKVGGSIPPRATNISYDINDLRFKPEIAISFVVASFAEDGERGRVIPKKSLLMNTLNRDTYTWRQYEGGGDPFTDRDIGKLKKSLLDTGAIRFTGTDGMDEFYELHESVIAAYALGYL